MNKHSHIHVTSVILSEGDNRLLFKLQLFFIFFTGEMQCSNNHDMFKRHV